MTSIESSFSTNAPKLPERLPLTAFESYMIADDQPDYPMVFVMRLELDGRIDQTAFTAALEVALARNPLLTARLDRDDRGGLGWVSGNPSPVLDFGPDQAPMRGGCVQPIDLSRESGLRIWVRVGEATSRIICQFHHACCDGVGAFHFIEDLLAVYARKYDGSGPELRPLDVRRLIKRGEFDIPYRSFWQRCHDTWITLLGSYQFLYNRVQPIAAPQVTGTIQRWHADDEGFIRHCLSSDLSNQLRKISRAQGVSLNDLLLRDLLLVIRQWNKQFEPGASGVPFRINVPINLRSDDDGKLSATNRLSFAFLARNPDACDSPMTLLQSIGEETRATIRQGLTLYFLGAVAAAHSYGLLERSLRRHRCLATAVLSNMGDPTSRFIAKFPRRDGLLVAGNLKLTNISGVPPMRDQTRAVFAVCDYDQKLTLSLRCDPRIFSIADTHRLLERYESQLTKSVA